MLADGMTLRWVFGFGQRVPRSPAFMAAAIGSVIRALYISIGVLAARKPRWAERKATFAFSPWGSTARSVRQSGAS
jgi:hypothetical protein